MIKINQDIIQVLQVESEPIRFNVSDAGLQGPAGADGVAGANGVAGADGIDGADGADGIDGVAPFPVLAARIFVGNYYRTGLGAIAQSNKAANVFTGGFYVPQESFVAEEIGPQPSTAADVMAKVGVYKLTDPSDPYTWELVAESGQFSCNTTAHVFDPSFECTFLKNEIYAIGVTPSGVVPLRDYVSGGGINLGQGLAGSQGNFAGESLGFNAGVIGDSLPASVTVAGLGQRPTMVWWKVKSLV